MRLAGPVFKGRTTSTCRRCWIYSEWVNSATQLKPLLHVWLHGCVQVTCLLITPLCTKRMRTSLLENIYRKRSVLSEPQKCPNKFHVCTRGSGRSSPFRSGSLLKARADGKQAVVDTAAGTWPSQAGATEGSPKVLEERIAKCCIEGKGKETGWLVLPTDSSKNGVEGCLGRDGEGRRLSGGDLWKRFMNDVHEAALSRGLAVDGVTCAGVSYPISYECCDVLTS